MNDNVLIFLKKLYSSAFSDFENMYVVGSTSRRLLHVGVDASQPPMEPVNSILDIDIVAGPITARPDTVFLRDIAEKLLSLELPGTRPDKKTSKIKESENLARIATQTSFQEGYSLEFEVKLYREISDADRNKPTTLMRRKVLIKEDFSANTLAALSSEPLDDLSEKGLVLLDRHDQPIRNHVALCDDKASYLETNESRSYFLRRVCYDLSTCGVVLPQQDRQWMQSDFFPALKSREPEERDFEYGCDMLLRMRRGLDFAPAVEMLKEENYLVWLLNCLPEVQEDIFQSMALDRFSFPALFH